MYLFQVLLYWHWMLDGELECWLGQTTATQYAWYGQNPAQSRKMDMPKPKLNLETLESIF
jgi:hypothetical protein